MPMDLVTDHLPGNAHAMHPATGANLVDVPDSVTDTVMIEIDPMFQVSSVTVTRMMNRLEIIASEQNGKLAGINLVILVTFTGDQFVAPRFRDNKLLNLVVEVAIQPAGHRAFFHG
jgi:hypothetical protein